MTQNPSNTILFDSMRFGHDLFQMMLSYVPFFSFTDSSCFKNWSISFLISKNS